MNSKEGNKISLEIDGIGLKSFEIIEKFDFTHDRKRMSVLVKDLQNNNYMLLVKGADSGILQILSSSLLNQTYLSANQEALKIYSD